ncbi:DNA-binding transcriptional regulator, MarR family [Amycolatopsis arida]|uniref:DNA-binding transcriptional regulator, MarR family n=1 Tax=Amycolatopsis arida TaxID=587909 RepID=A0A1I5SFE4_9PSEU|nr:MarR family transcriptional regulator [Amycolatopsis arida]TDX96503.1 DNA-binding MarR family transcriptional regulator [Amycolatopsis arida]SFP69056.1 DNA-binding transcriptional regulator, MarR family [Amycolatopsis arida]
MSGRDDAREQLGETLRRVFAEVVVHNHQIAQRLGLEASDSQALTHLGFHGPLTAGRLARLMNMGSGTMTGVLDRLENQGFVERQRDPGDRRKVIVTLRQEEVARRAAPLYRQHQEQLESVVEKFDDAELAVVQRFLQALLEASGTEQPDQG